MEEKKFTDATPDYYNDGDISCIEAMVAAKGLEKTIAFCECCAFKYEWRLGKKDSVGKEVSKIKKYLDLYLELSERLECERLGFKRGEIDIVERDSDILGVFKAIENVVALTEDGKALNIKEGELVAFEDILDNGDIRLENGMSKKLIVKKDSRYSFKSVALATIADLKKKGLTQRQIDDILKK